MIHPRARRDPAVGSVSGYLVFVRGREGVREREREIGIGEWIERKNVWKRERGRFAKGNCNIELKALPMCIFPFYDYSKLLYLYANA